MQEATPDEPQFVLTASDPAAPFALLAYASASRNRGDASEEYLAHLKALAAEFYAWQDAHGITAPGYAAHVTDKIDKFAFFRQQMRSFDEDNTEVIENER